MKRLTNKGQVLVAFILLLPIFIFLSAIIIDFGFLSIQKRKITNTVNDALLYAYNQKGNDNLEDELTVMIEKNVPELEQLQIYVTSKEVEIHITSKMKGTFEKLFDKEIYELNLTKKTTYKE